MEWPNTLTSLTPVELYGHGFVTTVLKLPLIAQSAYQKAATLIAEHMLSPIDCIRDSGRLLYLLFPAIIFGSIPPYHYTGPKIKKSLDLFNHFEWQILFQKYLDARSATQPTYPPTPTHHQMTPSDDN